MRNFPHQEVIFLDETRSDVVTPMKAKGVG
jgi:hypothetical protein